ncbi:MAG: extracellular solute-binding protein [Anaerolineae bacterium]|nr:extracellular solute-binding protein [Anaerolineae bacterium]MCB9107957.1 extracellular solute-binding protein [Anaerolineales bacterium]
MSICRSLPFASTLIYFHKVIYRHKTILLMVFLLGVSGCRSTPNNTGALSGHVILWHSWSPDEALVLEQALAEFRESNPQVTLVTLALPADDLLARFEQSANDGAGPDLLLGSTDWIGSLAGSGLIRPLNEAEIDALPLDSRATRLVEFQNNVYGIPLSLNPKALYFNQSLVDRPATTLDELLEYAADGQGVAFVPRFEAAYWGIQALGQGLFDPDGTLNLADSGFIDWLAWLKAAQNEPGVILNVDDQALRQLFIEGRIAYYIAPPEQQAALQQAMGEDTFGVTRLPRGPAGPAGPLLPAETALFYTFSSDQQVRTALALARFLANQQQSIRFMRELNRVPANRQVNVDPRIYPTVSGFARQANTAVILPNELDRDRFYAAGDRAYASALAGLLTPEEAVCRFGQEVVEAGLYSEDEIILPAGCSLLTDEPASN